MCRIARYAAAYEISGQRPVSLAPSGQVVNGSNESSNASRTSPTLPAQAVRGPISRPTVESRSFDASNESPTPDMRDRGGKSDPLPDSPTKAAHRQPSIFPGVVRQRTRRKSLRQSSGSENDYDASGGSGVGLSRSGILEPDGKGSASLVVPEETGA